MTAIFPLTRVQLGLTWVSPLSGDITLDETTTYVTGSFTVPFDEDYFAFSPVTTPPPRITVELSGDDETGTSIGYLEADVAIRSLTADREQDTMTFTYASDEAQLSEFSVLEPSFAGEVHAGSIRAAVNEVLDRALGAELEATPNDDGPILALYGGNLVRNPSVEVNADNWGYNVAGGTGGGARNNAGGAFDGSWYYRVTFTANAGTQFAGAVYGVDGVVGQTVYGGDAWVRPNFTQNMRYGVEFQDANGVPLGSPSYGPSIVCPGGVWTRIYHLNAFSPLGAAQATATLYGSVTGANWLNGNTLDADALRLEPALSSALTWQPGQSAWDYLLSLTAGMGLRLFCDEANLWRLVPTTYDLADTVECVPANLTQATQVLSRDNGTWADGVVVINEWAGADGVMQRKTETAGIEGKLQVITLNAPPAGQGAATLRLQRLQAQSLTYQVQILPNLFARPGQRVEITLPGDIAPAGRRLQSFAYDFGSTLMDIRARDVS